MKRSLGMAIAFAIIGGAVLRTRSNPLSADVKRDYRVGVGGQQRQTALLEVPGEAQPLVKMLADYFIRIAQFQQTTSNVVHALLVGRRAILPALVTRKPV